MRIVALCCVFACLILAFGVPAQARIRVYDAELERGKLVVSGSTTRRHQKVTLNGRYATAASIVAPT
jgi:hypothetical protein